MSSLSVVPDRGSVAPGHLRPATRAWFDQVARDYVLESHHLKVLQIAAECWDTYEAAREAIAQNGMTFINAKVGDIKARPEIMIARDSRTAFLRAIRELNL